MDSLDLLKFPSEKVREGEMPVGWAMSSGLHVGWPRGLNIRRTVMACLQGSLQFEDMLRIFGLNQSLFLGSWEEVKQLGQLHP